MNLRISGRGVDVTAPLRDYVSRRIHFALGRFARAVRSVSVRLSDVNGARGGADKQCVVAIETGFRHMVLVRETQPSVLAAVAGAAERAARAVEREKARMAMR